MRGRLLTAAEILWVGAVALLASDGGYSLEDAMFLLVGAGVLGLLWVVRVAAMFWRRFHQPREWPRKSVHIIWLLQEPVAVAAALVAAQLTLVGLGVRILASEPWLTEYARDVQANRVDWHSSRWVGLLYLTHAEVHGGAVRAVTAECGLFTDCGVAYSPRTRPTDSPEDAYRHLWGPWSHWTHQVSLKGIPIPPDLLKP